MPNPRLQLPAHASYARAQPQLKPHHVGRRSDEQMILREDTLIEAGPTAVLEAVTSLGAELNLEPLAMACARRARGAERAEDALAWADASILCNLVAASQLPVGWARQGREYSAHGVAAWSIETFGVDAGRNRELLGNLVAWITEAMRLFASVIDFQIALGSEGERRSVALQLRERLQVAPGVRPVLPAEFGPWLDAVRAVGS